MTLPSQWRKGLKQSIYMSKSLAYIGIDPGKSGALCLLVPETKRIEFIKTTEKPMDIYSWLSDIDYLTPIQVIMLEKVHAIQGTSAGSNFSFGFNTGLVNGLAGTVGCSVDHVTPKTWQKYIGVTKQGKAIKKEVGEIVTRLYPKAEIHGPRGGLLDGRADALCIAHFASHKWRI